MRRSDGNALQATMFLDLWDSRMGIGICVFSALARTFGVYQEFIFSLVQAPLLRQDWKRRVGDLSFTWKSSLLTRLADQFLIQVYGSERGGSPNTPAHGGRGCGKETIVQARSIPLYSPCLSIFCLHLLLLRYLGTLDLISGELVSGKLALFFVVGSV